MSLRAVHNGRPHKIAKNWPLFPCPQNVRTIAQPLLSVRTHHKFRKIRSVFAQKSADIRIWRISFSSLVRKMFALDKPSLPLTAEVFYGRPLTRKDLLLQTHPVLGCWKRMFLFFARPMGGVVADQERQRFKSNWLYYLWDLNDETTKTNKNFMLFFLEKY